MKKITKIAATFAATMAILFGAASCSHDGGASLAALSLTDDDDDKDPPVTTVTNYTLSIDNNFSKVEGPAGLKKLDDTVTVYVGASGKSIQPYPKAEPPVVKMTSSGVNIAKDTEYGLQLTLAADAKITITALTKHGVSKDVQWVLKDVNSVVSDIVSTGTPAIASAEIKDGINQDMTPATLTFASVPKGTYMLGANSDGGYLFSLKIEYNK